MFTSPLTLREVADTEAKRMNPAWGACFRDGRVFISTQMPHMVGVGDFLVLQQVEMAVHPLMDQSVHEALAECRLTPDRLMDDVVEELRQARETEAAEIERGYEDIEREAARDERDLRVRAVRVAMTGS